MPSTARRSRRTARRRAEKGAFGQAIGRSRGGRTTKIHALTDADGRPRVVLLTPGNVADITVAPTLIAAAGLIERLVADKGYDADSLRRLLTAQGTEAVIPSTRSRKRPIPYDAVAYRQRNLIERMFGRLKDFRRIATRDDRRARNVLAAACLFATICY